MLWVLYGYYVILMCGGQNSTEGHIVLERIFYISLFECKGASMLKTYSLIF